MEQFLINEEKIENQPSSKMRDSEFIDYFADIPDESEHVCYLKVLLLTLFTK